MNMIRILLILSFSTALLAGCAGSKPGTTRNLVFDDNTALSGQQAAGREALVAFHDALKAKSKGEMDRAETLFLRVISLNPDNDAAYFELSRLALTRKDVNQAAAYAQQALKLDPDNPFYLDLNAGLLRNFGQLREALAIYNRLIADHPENANYYFEAGYLQEQLKDYKGAIATYDKLQQLIGPEETLIMQKHQLYLMMNNIQGAAAEVQQLIDLYPNEGRYYGILGEMYESAGMPAMALEAYQQLIARDPDNPYASFSLATFYRRNGETDKYRQYIYPAFSSPQLDIDLKVAHLLSYIDIIKVSETQRKEAFELGRLMTEAHPGEAKAFAMYGDLLFNGGDKPAALETYRQSLALNNSIYSVWQQVMYLTAELQDFKGLDTLTEEAMGLFPSQALPYFLHGVAKNQLHEYRAALPVLDRALLIGGSSPLLAAEIYASLGDTHHALEHHTESDSCYEASLRLNPDNAFVLNNYSYYLSLRKIQLDKAADMARKANELEPGTASFLDTYGWVLYQKGQYEQARQWLGKALEAGGNQSAAILEHYGDVLFQLNKVDEAVSYWQLAVEAGGEKATLDKKINARELYE